YQHAPCRPRFFERRSHTLGAGGDPGAAGGARCTSGGASRSRRHLRWRSVAVLWTRPMRIATWNVNSLKARLDKVTWWLERAAPDVLLMQETKPTDADAPHATFEALGYRMAHHGEGRWNGVAILSRVGLDEVETNFGAPLAPPSTADGGDGQPMAEAR